MTDRIDYERAEILAKTPPEASTRPMKPLLSGAGTGRMAQAIRECLEARKAFLAGVMERSEVDRITGEGLRQVWEGRAMPWKFLCRFCSDTGWIVSELVDDRSEFMYGPGASRREAFKCIDCRYWHRQAEEAAQKRGQSDDPTSSAASTTKRDRRTR